MFLVRVRIERTCSLRLAQTGCSRPDVVEDDGPVATQPNQFLRQPQILMSGSKSVNPVGRGSEQDPVADLGGP